VVINGIKITHSNKINRNSEGPCTKYAVKMDIGYWMLSLGEKNPIRNATGERILPDRFCTHIVGG